MTLCLCLLILGQLSLTALAADGSLAFIEENIYFRILELTDLADKDLNLAEVFEKKEGQDLYLAAFHQQQIMPIQNVIRGMSQNYSFYNTETKKIQNFSQAEIRDYLIHGAIPSYYQDISLVGVNSVLNQIEQNFNNEVEVERLRNKLHSFAAMNEIFANGDTSDSGFDIITDLEVVETILFKEAASEEISEVEGSSGNNIKVNPTELIAIPGDLNEETANSNQTNSEPTNPTNDSTSNSNQTNQEDPAASNTNQNPNETDPNICFADPNLQAAINEYQNINGDAEDNDDQNENNNNNNDNSNNNNSDYHEPSTSDKFNDVKTTFSSILPANPADWTDFLPCNKYFCLKVSFQNNDDEEDIKVYKKEDNCIACHIRFIYNNFYELNSNSLAPGKVSGNFLEPGICKKAVNEVSPAINITLVKEPIISPINDLILDNDNAAEQLREIYALPLSIFQTPNPAPISPEEQISKGISNPYYKIADQINEYSKLKENYFLGEAYVDVEDLINDIDEEIEKKLKFKIAAIQIEASGSNFQAIEYEMIRMNTYFESFLSLLGQLVNGEEPACQILDDKKTCN